MDFVEIPLTKGKVAIVDAEDLEIISEYKWHALKIGYAATSVGGRKNKKMIYMHRLITNVGPDEEVDHINHNKLDNRKINLRICSHRKNGGNLKIRNSSNKTSEYKGVYFDKSRNKYAARIKVNYIGIFLGRFDNEKDAALAYNAAAIKHFGDFACLNEI